MRKLITTFLILGFLSVVQAHAAVTPQDYKTVIKTTKTMLKLSEKNNIDELSKYYSLKYKSFDGYNKDTIIKIYKLASKLYPDIKTKSKITKVETADDYIKVFIEENSYGNPGPNEHEIYAGKDKGRLEGYSFYSITFKNEDGIWLALSDEIYDEFTDIRYGDALKYAFEMEVPNDITPNEEFSVKTNLILPENVVAIASIGHDKIVFPPKKYLDPYRILDDSGILERVMNANKEGRNEYINALYLTVSKVKNSKNEIKPVCTGMGVAVKRVNVKENL